jgi:hypothetical protein
LLGHTTMRSTQVYAKVVEKKVSEDMALLNRKLGSQNFIALPEEGLENA